MRSLSTVLTSRARSPSRSIQSTPLPSRDPDPTGPPLPLHCSFSLPLSSIIFSRRPPILCIVTSTTTRQRRIQTWLEGREEGRGIRARSYSDGKKKSAKDRFEVKDPTSVNNRRTASAGDAQPSSDLNALRKDRSASVAYTGGMNL